MLSQKDKITYLNFLLLEDNSSYADSFKSDIMIYFDDFKDDNERLRFLVKLKNKEEIKSWLENLLSQIVLKFDEEFEQLFDFIDDYAFV